ncbi:hypothetical protein MIR68_011181 [Amoeboaphelidium protococcarum]|nr:hypothetical protein MIR68_011181 [Amoeboaphelidium protococcarum]
MSNFKDSIDFINQKLGLKLTTGQSEVHKALKDGVVLCQLINALSPGCIQRISTKPLPFLQIENINNFIDACRSCDVGLNELFEAQDLFKGQSLDKVNETIIALKRQVESGKVPNRDSLQKPSKRSSMVVEMKHSKSKNMKLPNAAEPSPNFPRLTVEGQEQSAAHDSTGSLEADEIASSSKQKRLMSNQDASRAFVEKLLGKKFESTSFQNDLRDGVVLCQLMNILSPDSVKDINMTAQPYQQMENIYRFVEAAKVYGVKQSELFQTSDLYEGRDFPQVLVTLASLQRIHKAQQQQQQLQVQSKSVVTRSTFSDSPQLSVNSSSTNMNNKQRPKSQHGSSVGPRMNQQNSVESFDTDAKGLRLSVVQTGVNETTGEQYEDSLDYQLGDCIGRGQFGSVYRALELGSGSIFAIKRVKLDQSTKAEYASVMKEVDLLKSLSHPNIVKYEGIVINGGYLNIILEFVENGSLYHTMKQFGAFPEKLVLYYTFGMLEGLAYLHDKGVVHCDLKAANILTTKTGVIKLGDFGVSKELRFDQGDTSVAGTPNWMAPEIIELKGASPASDIWSLACTIVELLTTHPPYFGFNAMTALFKIVEDDCPPLPENISPELKNFLQQCFNKQAAGRPSAKQLLNHEWLQKGKNGKNTVRMSPSQSVPVSPAMVSGMQQLSISPPPKFWQDNSAPVSPAIQKEAPYPVANSIQSRTDGKQEKPLQQLQQQQEITTAATSQTAPRRNSKSASSELGGKKKPKLQKSKGESKKKDDSKCPITWKSLAVTFAIASAGLYYLQQEKNALMKQKAQREAEKRGIQHGQVKVGGPFSLIDAKSGKAVTEKDFQGKFMLMYFGFTNCPDVCPDELEKMARAIEKVDSVSLAGSQIQKKTEGTQSVGDMIAPIFISVDPKRDTPEVVKKYLEEFSPRFVGLTGEDTEIDKVAKSYRIYVSKGDPIPNPNGKGEDDYLVDHSIFFFLMDPNGAFVDFYGRNATADEIADKLVKRVREWKLHKDSNRL